MSGPAETESTASYGDGLTAAASASRPAVLHATTDLVARFGTHWSVGYGGDEVVQNLGWPREDDATSFETREEAVVAARARRAKKMEEAAKSAARILNYWCSRVQIAMARLGFGADHERLLQRASELRDKVAAAACGVADWSPEVRPLPKAMRGPVLLEAGRPVWRIRATWPLEEGVRVDRIDIGQVDIYPFLDGGSGFDVSFNYHAGEGRDAFHFSHNTADAETVEIATGYINHWAFLTQEAARACVAVQTAKLRAAADAAESAVEAAR